MRHPHSKILQNISRKYFFQNKCHQNNTKYFIKIFHKKYIIFHTIYLVLFLNTTNISRITHACHRFQFYHISHNIYHDFTEMAALQKICFAASYARWADSRSNNAYCCQPESILTDSLLIASKFMSIFSISKTWNAIAMCCIAQRDRQSFSIRCTWCSSKFCRSALTQNYLCEPL